MGCKEAAISRFDLCKVLRQRPAGRDDVPDPVWVCCRAYARRVAGRMIGRPGSPRCGDLIYEIVIYQVRPAEQRNADRDNATSRRVPHRPLRPLPRRPPISLRTRPPISIARSLSLSRSVSRNGSTACSSLTTANARVQSVPHRHGSEPQASNARASGSQMSGNGYGCCDNVHASLTLITAFVRFASSSTFGRSALGRGGAGGTRGYGIPRWSMMNRVSGWRSISAVPTSRLSQNSTLTGRS